MTIGPTGLPWTCLVQPTMRWMIAMGTGLSDGDKVHVHGTLGTRIDSDSDELRHQQGDVHIVNCIVAGNGAARGGGGIYVQYGSRAQIAHCTIVNNSAPDEGGGVRGAGQITHVQNSIVWGNGSQPIQGGQPSVTTSCVEGGFEGTGNRVEDPLLVPDAYRLRPESPCIDAGLADGTLTVDLHGEAPWDDPTHTYGASIVDIGAERIR